MPYVYRRTASQIEIGGGMVSPYVEVSTVAADKALTGLGYNLWMKNIVGNPTVAYLDLLVPRIVNTAAATNGTFGIQYIQVMASATGSWTNAIKLFDGAFGVAASAERHGGRIVGQYDISDQLEIVLANGEDLYVQWAGADAIQNNLRLYEVQSVLRAVIK